MTRGIFLAGNDSALCRAIEAETINRVDKYTAAIIPNRLSVNNHVGTGKPAGSDNDKRLSLDWNPSSPISARTLVLAAENRLERIDEAILVCSPPSIRSSAAVIPLSDIEIMINDHMKGWFYLIRELASVFSGRERETGTGTLALVYTDVATSTKKDDAADVLGPAALASFRALTQGLLSSAHNEKYITAGFSVSDAGNEAAFASYLFKTLDELTGRSNGKLHKFGKFKLF